MIEEWIWIVRPEKMYIEILFEFGKQINYMESIMFLMSS